MGKVEDMVKLQEAPQMLATSTGLYTTSPAREIVMPDERTTRSSYDAVRAARARTRNRDFVAAINAQTPCAHCGRQPIEWHNPDHVLLKRQSWRITNLVWQPASLAVIQGEMARCTPLCRRCHMVEDGRMAALKAKQPHQRGDVFSPKPCVECGRAYKPLRKGLCKCCDGRRRYAATRTLRVLHDDCPNVWEATP